MVVGVRDGDGGQELTGPGGGVAAVEGVYGQVVVHPQCHRVQLLNTTRTSHYNVPPFNFGYAYGLNMMREGGMVAQLVERRPRDPTDSF